VSVITVVIPEYRGEYGFADPGLPTAVWQVSGLTTGDASGGTNALQVNLKSAGQPVGEFFSLEQLSTRNEEAADNAMLLSVAGMETFGPDGEERRWSLPDALIEASTSLLLPLTSANPRLFIGRAGNTATAGTLTIQTSNGDGEDVRVSMMGYVWTPRSILVDGGIRRPVSGLFPN